MSTILNNPFRTAPGSQPPYLAGRDTEMETARFAVGMTRAGAPPNPVILTGLRGMGKTAVLRRAADEAGANKAIVLYAEATRNESLAAIFRESLEAARDRFDSLPGKLKQSIEKVARYLPKAEYELPAGGGAISLQGSGNVPEQKPFVTLLRELNTESHKHGRYLMLVIDELQESSLEDLNQLVRFIHATAGTSEPVLLLGAGLPSVRAHLEKAKTYTERWQKLNLDFLDAEQTREAILKPIQEAGHAIGEIALHDLVIESAGYPFFVQEYASAAWQRHKGRTIEESDVAAIIPMVRQRLDESVYTNRFRSLTPRECKYVLTLADMGKGPHTVQEIAENLGGTSQQVSSIRNQLVKKDVLFVPDVGMVEFRMPLTDRYITQHRRDIERRSRAKESLVIKESVVSVKETKPSGGEWDGGCDHF